jgi:putative DNA primase/helicase
MIPQELKKFNQWVLWKLENRNGKTTKVPYTLAGQRAQTNNPKTWASFDNVASTSAKGYAGIGFVFSKDDGLIGIDVDHPADSSISLEIIDKFQETYCERSPSDKLRIFTKGTLPRCGKGNTDKLIEVYNHTSPRYLTVTGNWIDTTSLDITNCQDALDWLFAKYFDAIPPVTPSSSSSPSTPKSSPKSLKLDDDYILYILSKAKNSQRFNALFNGLGGKDNSTGDLAMARILAFYTQSKSGQGLNQLDRLMRRSSRANLHNGKWDKIHSKGQTYGQITMEKAITGLSVTYSSPTPILPPPNTPNTLLANTALSPALFGKFNTTDVGNGERFKALHINKARYCHLWDKWIIWDGTHWEIDQGALIFNLSKQVIQNIHAELEACQDAERGTELKKHAKASERKTNIQSMLWCAGNESGMGVKPADLDNNGWLLNVANGTLDLRTGQLRPHSQTDYLTKALPIPYNPQAQCPRWRSFLNDVTGSDLELTHYLHKAMGYTLTGDMREQCFFFLYGFGSNGKSTFTTILEELMANGQYAIRTPAKTLMKNNTGGEGVPNDKARLVGARLVLAAEVTEGATLDEAFIKDITGQDTISARFLHKEFFDFKPQFKLWMYGNHKPMIKGTDNGIRRRPRLIPFNQTFAGDKKDPDLLEKLKSELPGILAWTVEGCLLWLKEGLKEPAIVTDATQEYFDEMDVIGLFIEECCVIATDTKATAKSLYEKYVGWCLGGGEKPVNQRKFGQRLTEKGYLRKKANGICWWIGIAIQTEFSPVPIVPNEYPIEINGYCEISEKIQEVSLDSTHSTLNSEFTHTREKIPPPSPCVHKKEKLDKLGTMGTGVLESHVVTGLEHSTLEGQEGYLKGTMGTDNSNNNSVQSFKSFGRLSRYIEYLHGKLPHGLRPNDLKFVKECLGRFDDEEIPAVLNGYILAFQDGMNGEVKVGRKENAGLARANEWLRDLAAKSEGNKKCQKE